MQAVCARTTRRETGTRSPPEPGTPDELDNQWPRKPKRQPEPKPTHPKPSQTEIAYVRQRTGDDGEPRPPPPNATAPRAHIRALTDRATTVRALELLCLRRLIT